jgi:hypothetical protein
MSFVETENGGWRVVGKKSASAAAPAVEDSLRRVGCGRSAWGRGGGYAAYARPGNENAVQRPQPIAAATERTSGRDVLVPDVRMGPNNPSHQGCAFRIVQQIMTSTPRCW